MTWTIHGEPASGSFIPEALLAEALGDRFDAEVTLLDVSLDRMEQQGADFLKLNPLGYLPAVITPEGTLLAETAALAILIPERFPEANLAPQPGDPERGKFLRWVASIATSIYPAITRRDYPERFSTNPAHAAEIRDAAVADARRLWLLVQQHLAPAPYALGQRFSALDVQIAAMSRWAVGMDFIRAECPLIERLARTVAARPRITPVWARHFPTR